MSFRLARRTVVAAIFAATLAAPVAAHAFTPTPFGPIVEAQNFSKIEERQAIYNTPGYQLLLRTVGARNAVAAAAEQVNDPEREFVDHVCSLGRGRLRRRRFVSTTGRRTATGSCSRCSSRRVTARRSPATCGRRAPAPPSARAW